VLHGDLKPLLERHQTFPEIVLRCAIDDFNYAVVELLLKQGYKPKFAIDFKSVFQSDDSKKFGFKTVCIEPSTVIEKKFEMIEFLIERNAINEADAIPHFLKERYLGWKSRGNVVPHRFDIVRFLPFIASLFSLLLAVFLLC
jgi:hypothetical protein